MVKCFVCNQEMGNGDIGILVNMDEKSGMCSRCSKILDTILKMTERKMVAISKLSLDALQSQEMQNAFCENCPLHEYHAYERDVLTGIERQPHYTCQAEFGIGSDSCTKKEKFVKIVETLAEADEELGRTRDIKVVL